MDSLESKKVVEESFKSTFVGLHKSQKDILLAVSNGNLQHLKELISGLVEDGKNVGEILSKIIDRDGQTVLHIAAYEGNLQLCKYLVEDLNLDLRLKTTDGKTPLILASLGGHMGTALYLLDQGANPNTTDDAGFTPLHYVAERGDNQLLELLLLRGSEVNIVSSLGTPLQRAAGAGKHEALQTLLNHNADPNLYYHTGLTPLAATIIAESLCCTKLLLEADADFNAGSCGGVPILLAASEGLTDTLKLLVKWGANADVVDDVGLKAIEIAALKGNRQDVETLVSVSLPIPTYLDWTVDGIIKHIDSEEAKIEVKAEQSFKEAKLKGEEAFSRNDYLVAIFWYSKAIFANPLDKFLLSKRSLCWALTREGDKALDDARKCLELDPKWAEAHYREGVAWSTLKKYDSAVAAFRQGIDLDPNDKELKVAFQRACEADLADAI